MITERQQCEKFFGLWNGERHRYSLMKRAQPEIDKRIADGVLVGQITLWEPDMVIFRAKSRTSE